MTEPNSIYKKKIDKKILLLLIVPFIVIIGYILLSNTRGHFYYGYNSDPDYTYLLNSLSIVNNLTPGHVDHPGTPLQTLGAIVIKISNLGKSIEEINTNLIKNPEYYLVIISIAIFMMFICAIILIGIVGYLFLKDILLAMILQSSSFISISVFRCISRVYPESLLLIICTIFLIIILFHFKYDIEKHSLIYSIIFGIICGLGIATKVTFIPLLIVPIIILSGKKNKLLFLLITLFSFVIFTIPTIRNYPHMFKWFVDIFSHSGKYGGGEQNIIDFHTLLNSVFLLISKNYIYLFLNSLSGLITIFIFLKHKKALKQKENRFLFRLIIALLCSTVFQILMTLKQFSNRYLIPSMMITIFTLVIAYIFLKENKIFSLKLLKIKNNLFYIICFIFISCLFLSLFSIVSYKKIKHRKSLSKEAVDFEFFFSDNYNEYTKIYYYGSSSIEYSLFFYDKFYNNSNFYKYIKKEYYDDKVLFYYDMFLDDIFGRYFFDWDNNTFKTLPNPEKSIFVGTDRIEQTISTEYKNRLKNVYSINEFTNVYEITK